LSPQCSRPPPPFQRPEGEESEEEVAGAGRFSSGTSLSVLYHQHQHRHIIAFIMTHTQKKTHSCRSS
jgi:hypothetical protein